MKKLIYALLVIIITGTLGIAQFLSGTVKEVAWDHDGLNVTGFAITVDGVRTDLGMTPVKVGTTYTIPAPAQLNVTGSHTITVEAYNGNGNAVSLPLTITVYKLPNPVSNLRIIRAS